MSEPRGRIHDIGYRPFDGQYRGRTAALAAMVGDDAKRALGVKQGTAYKVILGILLIAVVAIVATQLFTSQLAESASTTGQGLTGIELNPYRNALDSLGFLLIFVSALVGPTLLCGDRGGGALPLYLARPIRFYDYLVAKAAALMGVLLAVTLGPTLALFGAKVVLASEPGTYLARHVGDLGAILAGSGVLALLYASLALAAASLTTNRGYAAGGLIGGLLLLSIVPGLLFVLTENAWLTLVDIAGAASYVKDALFGELATLEIPLEFDGQGRTVRLDPLPVWVYAAETAALVVLAWLVIGLQYRRELR